LITDKIGTEKHSIATFFHEPSKAIYLPATNETSWPLYAEIIDNLDHKTEYFIANIRVKNGVHIQI